MAFSENLIRERRARSLSQEKLAELVGVSRQTVSQWENGYTEPDLTRLRRLAELFDLSLDELVEGPRPAKEEAASAPEEPAGPWRWESLPHSGVRTLAFEYRSRRTLFGLPLVHIHLGRGRSVATGILAIGNVARGAVAIGSVSAGLIAVGGVSAGLLFSLGGLAVGFLALGGLAVGDAVVSESAESEAVAEHYANVIAVRAGEENDEKIQALVEVLKSDEIRDFIDANYSGSVIAIQ